MELKLIFPYSDEDEVYVPDEDIHDDSDVSMDSNHSLTLGEYVEMSIQLRKFGVARQFCTKSWTFSPFHLAVRNGHIEIVKILTDLLQKKNQSFDFKDYREHTIFHVACQVGNLEIVKFLYEQVPSGFEIVGQGGQTPLHLACAQGHIQIAKTMVDTGLMFKKDNNGKNPLDVLLDQWSSHSFGELFQKITNLIEENQEKYKITKLVEEYQLEYKITEEESLCLELLFSKLEKNK